MYIHDDIENINNNVLYISFVLHNNYNKIKCTNACLYVQLQQCGDMQILQSMKNYLMKFHNYNAHTYTNSDICTIMFVHV